MLARWARLLAALHTDGNKDCGKAGYYITQKGERKGFEQ